MIIPIRCFTCGKVIANKWKKYCEYIENSNNNSNNKNKDGDSDMDSKGTVNQGDALDS